MRLVPRKYQQDNVFQSAEDIFQLYREIQEPNEHKNHAMCVKKASLLKLAYAASKIIDNPTLQEDLHPILDDIFLSKVLTPRFQMDTRSPQRIKQLIQHIRE